MPESRYTNDIHGIIYIYLNHISNEYLEQSRVDYIMVQSLYPYRPHSWHQLVTKVVLPNVVIGEHTYLLPDHMHTE